MNQEKLNEILAKHDLWLNNQEGGERANLRSANLSYANLRYADLRYADLRSADLRYANLSSADLSSANLSSADLRSANLRYADLSSANLSSADLRYADLSSARYWACRGNNKTIKTIHCDIYDIAYTDKVLQIGCEQHDILDWFKFDDDRIQAMDGDKALSFWKIWKSIIKKIIKYSPAESTGVKEE